MKTLNICATIALLTLTLTACSNESKDAEPLTSKEDAIKTLRQDVYGGRNLPDGELQLTMDNACEVLRTGKEGGQTFEFASEVYYQAVKEYLDPMQVIDVITLSVRSTCPELLDWVTN